MSVQARSDLQNLNIVMSGDAVGKDAETIAQDATRTVDLVRGTIMAQNATSREWEPYTDITATDGTGVAKGVFMGDDIAAATLVAGDVANQPVIVGGSVVTLDSSLITFENSLTANTVVAGTTLAARRVEDDLAAIGLFLEATIDIDELEN